MPDLGEAYGDTNVPADPYTTGTDAADDETADLEVQEAESLAEPAIEDNPDPEYQHPLEQFTIEEATFLAASQYISELAPGVHGLGSQIVKLHRILGAWYQQGREDGQAGR